MTNKNSNQPPEGTPEFKKWLKKQTTRDMEDIFGEEYQPADFEEGGANLVMRKT